MGVTQRDCSAICKRLMDNVPSAKLHLPSALDLIAEAKEAIEVRVTAMWAGDVHVALGDWLAYCVKRPIKDDPADELLFSIVEALTALMDSYAGAAQPCPEASRPSCLADRPCPQ